MTRSGGAALPIAGVSLLTLAMLGVAVIAGAATPSDSARADGLALDIPPAYLAAYQAASDRFALGADGWSYLAAIGKVETRSRTVERAGRPLGAEHQRLLRGPDADPQRVRQRRRNLGPLQGRRRRRRPHGHLRPGRRDRHCGGLPAGVRRAPRLARGDLRVQPRRLVRRAKSSPARPRTAQGDGERSRRPWCAADRALACAASGLPWRAMRRPNRRRRRVPGRGPTASTSRTASAARRTSSRASIRSAWRPTSFPSTATGTGPGSLATRLRLEPGVRRAGCAGRGPFRVILYNGYPGHGDPRHSTSPHLHLSWQHAPAAPFTRAAWVRVLAARSKR